MGCVCGVVVKGTMGRCACVWDECEGMGGPNSGWPHLILADLLRERFHDEPRHWLAVLQEVVHQLVHLHTVNTHELSIQTTGTKRTAMTVHKQVNRLLIEEAPLAVGQRAPVYLRTSWK